MIKITICFVFCSDNIMLANNSLIKANLTENYQRFSAKRNKKNHNIQRKWILERQQSQYTLNRNTRHKNFEKHKNFARKRTS